jgi:hypothetical protein
MNISRLYVLINHIHHIIILLVNNFLAIMNKTTKIQNVVCYTCRGQVKNDFTMFIPLHLNICVGTDCIFSSLIAQRFDTSAFCPSLLVEPQTDFSIVNVTP